jgi:cell division protein FtsL
MNENEQEPLPESALPPAEAVPPNTDERPETQSAIPAYVPIPPTSRFKRFLRSATRWVSVALVAFLVGIAVMAYPLLRAQANLKSVEKERDQANTKIAEQTTQLASMQDDQARLVVLRALSELRAAKLALSTDDEINVPLFIDKAAQAMKAVPDTLMETQQGTITKIQQKLALAQEKAKSNLKITKPELDQLLADSIENLRNLDELLNSNP